MREKFRKWFGSSETPEQRAEREVTKAIREELKHGPNYHSIRNAFDAAMRLILMVSTLHYLKSLSLERIFTQRFLTT